MQPLSKIHNFTLISLLLFFIFPNNIIAQLDVAKGSFSHPSIMQLKEFKHELRLLLATLPEDAIESSSTWIYAPLLEYNAKLGLPNGFNLNLGLSSNIITHQIRGGGKWGYSFGRFTLATGLDSSFWYGRLNDFGFNTTAKGWQSFFNLNMGINFNKFTLTLIAELDYLITLRQAADDIQITSTNQTGITGASFSILIDQPVWKENFMSLGFKVNYSRYHWPTWAVFPSWDRYLFIPEVIIGFIL